jgi:hypothetical protein
MREPHRLTRCLNLAVILIIVRLLPLVLIDRLFSGKVPLFACVAVTMLPELVVLFLVCSATGVNSEHVAFNYLYIAVMIAGASYWSWYFTFRSRVMDILFGEAND